MIRMNYIFNKIRFWVSNAREFALKEATIGQKMQIKQNKSINTSNNIHLPTTHKYDSANF